MSKIAIVGAGNAGCISALTLNFLKETEAADEIDEIVIYHDPNTPIERVGQGTILTIRNNLFECLDLNWYDKNSIKATIKAGIRYLGWGKENHDFMHAFTSGGIACHYVPKLLSNATLESGKFTVVEGEITDPDNQIDSDYIIDCRGKPKLDKSYERLTNPLNTVLLSKKEPSDPKLLWTDCIATPNGWTFVIPNHDSVSYGYLYNDSITTREDAESDFCDSFAVEIDGELRFDNYVAKNIWASDRRILNGNRYSFIEPLEATASGIHNEVAESFFDFLLEEKTKEEVNKYMYNRVKQNQDFILMHYANGSKYDTPFWDYARSLEYSDKKSLQAQLDRCKGLPKIIDYGEIDEKFLYGQWEPPSFTFWEDKVGGP